jgi:hypothetical protein
MVQKVSSVVSSSSGGGGGIYRTSTDLAGKLNHPPDPHTTRTDAFDNLFLGCGCGTVIFFGIIWFIGAGIALGIAHLIGNTDPHDWEYYGGFTAMALAAVAMIISAIISNINEKNRVKAEYPIWKRKKAIWGQLYYCHRDDIVFIPGRRMYVPADQTHEFLDQLLNTNIV